MDESVKKAIAQVVVILLRKLQRVEILQYFNIGRILS